MKKVSMISTTTLHHFQIHILIDREDRSKIARMEVPSMDDFSAKILI